MQKKIIRQTNVDKVTNKLDSLSSYIIDNWKINHNINRQKISLNPYDKNYDDSVWAEFKLKEKTGFNYCWFRKKIVLPDKILGQPIKGKFTLRLTLFDSSCLWVNGESKGYFFRNGNFVLTENAKPGDKFSISIEAFDTASPIRFTNAEIIFEDLEPGVQKVKDFILSLRTGQKLLSFDTYQTGLKLGYSPRIDPGIDKSTFNKNEKRKLNKLLQKISLKVNVNALKRGQFEKFEDSLDNVHKELKPISDYSKRFTLYFTSNAHIDAAWLWRYKETILVCRNTFISVLNIMNLNKNLTYTQSSVQYYKWMEDFYPDIFKKIKEKIKEGRWEIVGGQWIEPDCNMPDGVSWDRQFLYAQDYFRKNFGKDAKLGWVPDSFGYNWNIPMFCLNAGIDAFLTQKIGWNDTNIFPHKIFWWQSPDGSKVLTYFPFSYDGDVGKPFNLIDQLRQYESNTGFRKMMILFGVGDHGGGPTLDMLNRIEHLKILDIFPNIEYGTSTGYLDWLKTQNLSKVPVWKGELYLEYHRGTFTSCSEVKKNNRLSEGLLTQAEKFNCISGLFSGRNHDKDLNDAWLKVMFNQFHDILPGSSIQPVYPDAMKYYKSVKKTGDNILAEALDIINKNINTEFIEEGTPVTVFNPLSWKRTDVVKLKLTDKDKSEYSVYDLNSKKIISQLTGTKGANKEIIFIAKNVPPIGYKTYVLKKAKPGITHSSLSVETDKMENNFFKIDFNSSIGWIKQITDKRNGKKILTGEGNKLQLLGDVGGAWNIKYNGINYPLHFVKAKVIEAGPVRSVLRFYREYPANNYPSSFFQQDVILYDGIDRIDFKLYVDMQQQNTMLKVAFPVAVSNKYATYEIPYGTIQRSTEDITSWQKARFEMPAEKWADLSDKDYGVSLLNNSKYGYDIKGNIMRLSLLRTPNYPQQTVAFSDIGKHIINYSLYPHSGDWKQANTIQAGYDFNQPLIPVLNTIHKGNLPEENSFISLDENNLILTSVKKALNSDAWVLQWYESKGKDTNAILKLPETPKRIFESNFLEEDLNPVKFEGRKIKVHTKKFSVTTLKVYFK